MFLLIPPFLAIAFVYWILYHLLIQRDLKKHLAELALAFTFFAIWTIVYFAVINS
jgi:hypothetical protein